MALEYQVETGAVLGLLESCHPFFPFSQWVISQSTALVDENIILEHFYFVSKQSQSFCPEYTPIVVTLPQVSVSHYLPAAKMIALGQDGRFQPFMGTKADPCSAITYSVLIIKCLAFSYLIQRQGGIGFRSQHLRTAGVGGTTQEAALKGELCLSPQSKHCGEMVGL